MASDIVWVQEEHQNQGAFTFVYPRLQALTPIKYVGREPLAASAVGTSVLHKKEVEKLYRDALA